MKITDLPLDILLDQAAEENTELAHACLKLSRVIRGVNVTPVTDDEATSDMVEEYADVLVTMTAVLEKMFPERADFDEVVSLINRKQKQKQRRWRARLNGKV